MQEITHCQNQRPIYETETSEILEWDDANSVKGICKENSDIVYHPVIFDIETSAKLCQEPILLFAYDSLEDTGILLYYYGYEGYTLDKQNKSKYFGELEPSNIIIENLSISSFEKHILKRVNKWNKKAKKRNDRNRKSLVCHNADFDIPMMGVPNDELLKHPKIDDKYEMSVKYSNFCMIGHRAGQFGQIFTFLNPTNEFESLNIPVGDTLVACKSLWIDGKLKNACNEMNVEIEVSEAKQHGILNDEYIKYCINDVFATYRLYQKLRNRIKNMFGNLSIEHIYSTASLGKFVLRKMGYKRPGYEQKAVNVISKSYFGGRTDAKVCGEIKENLRYTDILSQYPTVSKLTNVWEYMYCDTVKIEEIDTSKLPNITDMTKPENWTKVRDYYVEILPDNATLPVRTKHLDDTTKVVTANVKAKETITYHYMDTISAKLIDGKQNFEIIKAYKVSKEGKQTLQNTEIGDIKLKATDNVMAKCIQERKRIQKNSGKNTKTKCLKIVGNSMYGISAERIVKERDEYEKEKHDFASHNGYYNPHVASSITAGGRLMLAIGQSVANKHNSKLLYCDTDSLIIPDKCSDKVIKAFENLNPYDGYAGTLDVLEDEKEEIGKLYAVGTKKYIFFNDNGEILEYKEHGLGNYDNLRDSDIIKSLWATILYFDLGHNPLNQEMLYQSKLEENVIWQFNATTVSMRQLINEYTNDPISYGDWIESTISYDNEVRYLALDLREKSQKDNIVRAIMKQEDIVNVDTVNKEKMNQNEKLKTTEDIIQKFIQDSTVNGGKPNVLVTGKEIVTKESTSRKDIFVSNLERKFTENMGMAIDMLFG